MLLGTRPGEAYEDGAGRYYYDTEDGRTYRTDREGRGLFRWRKSDGGWEQLYGTAQWRSTSLGAWEERIRRYTGDGHHYYTTLGSARGSCGHELPTTDSGHVRGLRCGRNHGGNRRLMQDGKRLECQGCGGGYSTAAGWEAIDRPGEPGAGRLYDERV